jgi:hypothetical protein
MVTKFVPPSKRLAAISKDGNANAVEHTRAGTTHDQIAGLTTSIR